MYCQISRSIDVLINHPTQNPTQSAFLYNNCPSELSILYLKWSEQDKNRRLIIGFFLLVSGVSFLNFTA